MLLDCLFKCPLADVLSVTGDNRGIVRVIRLALVLLPNAQLRIICCSHYTCFCPLALSTLQAQIYVRFTGTAVAEVVGVLCRFI